MGNVYSVYRCPEQQNATNLTGYANWAAAPNLTVSPKTVPVITQTTPKPPSYDSVSSRPDCDYS